VNNYARLRDVTAEQAGLTAAIATAGGTDPIYLRRIDAASRAFENDCNGRIFYARKATRRYTGDGTATLYLPHDLISVETLTVDTSGDGTGDVTLVEDTDFWLRPEAAEETGRPYWQIDLIPWSTQLSAWPKVSRCIAITGLWGWSYELEATGLTGTVADASTTSLTASATAAELVYPGDTIIVESEQMYVSAVAVDTITVERGINGTTAAAHAAKAISVRRYPRDIEDAIKQRVIAGRWENNTGMPLGEPGRGYDVTYARYMDVVKSYRNKWVSF